MGPSVNVCKHSGMQSPPPSFDASGASTQAATVCRVTARGTQ